MEFFSIGIATIILRFFLMMAVIIVGVFTGQVWLTVLGLPIFLSIMLGVGLKKESKKVQATVARQLDQKSTAA